MTDTMDAVQTPTLDTFQGSGQEHEGDLLQLVTFRIGDEEFGVDILSVQEIIRLMQITMVPHAASFIEGVINLRGKVIPVMDVRLRFHLPAVEYNDRTCVVVVCVGDVTIGLVVDTVSEVVNIPESNISPPPRFSSATSGRYVSGMGKIGEAVKIIIDAEKLLRDDELAALAS